MLFKKDIEPRCAYCARGVPLEGESVLCKRKGVVARGDSCHRFQYDPLKRVPPKPAALDLSGFKDEDFSL